MSSRDLYLRLMRYVLPHWRVFAAAIGAMVVVALSEPAFPALMKPMLDGTFVEKDPGMIRLVPLALVLLFLVRGVASYVSDYAVSWVGHRVVLDLRNQMFAKLVSLPSRYYDDNATGNLISKLTYDVSQVTSAATSVLTVLIKDSLAITGLLAWLFYLNWRLTLIALTVGPVIAILVRLVSGRLRSMSRQLQRSMGDVTHVLEETIEGQRVVKVFGGQAYEAGRFHDTINAARLYALKQAAAAAANVPLVQLIAAVAMAVIVYLATVETAAHPTSVGTFVSFIMAMLMLLAPLKRLTGVNESLQRGLAAAESVFELIDEEPEPDRGTVTLGRARGSLEFQDVCFTYRTGTRPALDRVSLNVAPGETVALVGPSGSGKTTFANLIPRFYHPSSGRILVDGHDVAELTLASLRANVALVSQDVVLFNDTVAANIAYGPLRDTPRERIEAAAVAAHAADFIAEMEDGLDTMIGENGVRLSGGQRQRLAIARALIKDAPILILDEATSALDSESERQVQAALETLMQGRTTIVIAHRLSTIEKASRIVVLDRGRVAEVGSHAELIARDGMYAALHRTQFGRAEESAGLPA